MTNDKFFLKGFTLAELLIALAILGVIATFTIPKVLMSQQNQQYNAIAKETISMISGAYSAYQQDQTASASTQADSLTSYMNYVKVDTTSTLDEVPFDVSVTCSSSTPCVRLHNGALLWFQDMHFGGTTTNCLTFHLDPDGTYSGSPQTLRIHLLFNGRITTDLTPGYNMRRNGDDALFTCNPGTKPQWFQ